VAPDRERLELLVARCRRCRPTLSSNISPASLPEGGIPYSSAAMRQDLERVRGIWEDCQASRDRNAIYGYLTAVYDLVA
jgi:hypothetical protein